MPAWLKPSSRPSGCGNWADMDTFLLDTILRAFLAEDLEHGDITTEAIFTPEDRARGRASSPGTPWSWSAWQTVAARVFHLLDPTVSCTGAMADGSRVEAGAELLTLSGATRTLLRAERVALNLVQRLCGIATLTAAFADQVGGHEGENRRHPQDHAGPAHAGKICGPRQRRPQPPLQPERRRPDQGQPHRRLRLDHRGGATGAARGCPIPSMSRSRPIRWRRSRSVWPAGSG